MLQPADVSNTFDRIRNQAAVLSGVKSAGITTGLPLAQDFDYRVPFRFLSLAAPRHLEDQTAWHRMVSPGLFSALVTPLISGGDFTDQDGPDAPSVVIVNGTLARQSWLRGSPLVQRIGAASGGFGPLGRIIARDPQIVGVVADIKYSGPGRGGNQPSTFLTGRLRSITRRWWFERTPRSRRKR